MTVLLVCGRVGAFVKSRLETADGCDYGILFKFDRSVSEAGWPARQPIRPFPAERSFFLPTTEPGGDECTPGVQRIVLFYRGRLKNSAWVYR